MSDYQRVTEALKSGADPAMLCMTCPWDRYCISPPEMTSEEVQAQIDKAKADDLRHAREAEAKGERIGMPVGSLMTIIAIGGRDKSAAICPVLALRLRGPEGRQVVDNLKAQMTSWSES